MKNRQIVNLVNFVRAVEPRTSIDLIGTVREEIALMKKHHLRGTFLLQYDALIRDEYVTLMRELDPEQFELGVWYEIVQPQVEQAGLKWTGRYPWDWHVHCGFPMGYTVPEREKLVDVLFDRFFQCFGYYPRVFGSWIFDSHTARYVCDRYRIDAFCNCKEQYGTDGYTLWGGYYGQGYYPSRTNAFMPAQTVQQQLPAPVFRMLGSDPVYQYDLGVSINDDTKHSQGVITLEPVYPVGGGLPAWVDWYMQENFNGDCLSFGYAQAGQENSFGWNKIRDGLTQQCALLEQLCKEGKIEVEPLGETGRWFQKTYTTTPASAITAHTAYDDPDRSSVWYSTKHYRINLYGDHGSVRIRDLHVFREDCPDPFENTVCTENSAIYETLPVVDGNLYTGNGVWAGAYFTYTDGTRPVAAQPQFTDLGNGQARVTYGELTFTLKEKGFTITAPKPFTVENRIGISSGSERLMQTKAVTPQCLSLSYQGMDYALEAVTGHFVKDTVAASVGTTLELRIRNS